MGRYIKFGSLSIGQALGRYTHEYFAESHLRNAPPEARKHIIEQLGSRIEGVLRAPSPMLKLREELATVVYDYADLQVLCLLPEEKSEVYYGESQFISGELHRYIRKCVQHNNELREKIWSLPDSTDADLIKYCNTRCTLFLYFLNGFDLMRIEFDDREPTPDKDWLRPFTTSMLIWSENYYREKIGLPSLLRSDLDGLMHSTFLDIVVSGAKNPLVEWETHYQLIHREVSGTATAV
jgi:hypothetical protein